MKKNEIVQDILCQTFKDNKSTQFVVKPGKHFDKRLKRLIQYSIFYGKSFGDVILSKDKKSCAIILDTSKKKATLKSIFWDIKLMFQCIGILRVAKVLKREGLIKKHHPKSDYIHLWYIGVHPEFQGRGKGTELLKEIIEKARKEKKPVYLETSTEKNFKLYERIGFTENGTINGLGYEMKIYSI